MSETVDLYEEDFLLWTQEQAKLLRSAAQHGVNLPFDWENVAEEIESLGRSDRRELRSRIATIIEHLLKLEHSTVTEPREGWLDTVERSRQEAENLLKESPSLRREASEIVASAFGDFARIAVDGLIRRGEIDKRRHRELLAHPYTADQVLGQWLPGEPAGP
jgi:hypothetical protein